MVPQLKPAAGSGGDLAIALECEALQKSAVALHTRHKASGEWSRRRGARFTGLWL